MAIVTTVIGVSADSSVADSKETCGLVLENTYIILAIKNTKYSKCYSCVLYVYDEHTMKVL